SAALAEALGRRAHEFILANEAASAWLARLACARQWMPECPWPEFTEADLAEVLAAACRGRRTEDEVRRVPLVPLLQGRLTYEQNRALDELAPEALTVPSGHRIRLVYEPGRPPVLAVRLQELFGWAETPRIAGGR